MLIKIKKEIVLSICRGRYIVVYSYSYLFTSYLFAIRLVVWSYSRLGKFGLLSGIAVVILPKSLFA